MEELLKKPAADFSLEPEAEADPAPLYGADNYGLPYSGVYGGYRTYGAYPYSPIAMATTGRGLLMLSLQPSTL